MLSHSTNDSPHSCWIQFICASGFSSKILILCLRNTRFLSYITIVHMLPRTKFVFESWQTETYGTRECLNLSSKIIDHDGLKRILKIHSLRPPLIYDSLCFSVYKSTSSRVFKFSKIKIDFFPLFPSFPFTSSQFHTSKQQTANVALFYSSFCSMKMFNLNNLFLTRRISKLNMFQSSNFDEWR